MAQKASTNGQGLKAAPIAKDEFISFARKELNLQPDCSILDLDPLSALSQPIPEKVQLAIWLDSWSDLVCALGTFEDAAVGIMRARDILGIISEHADHMIFSVDTNKPPLDQYKKGERMLFEASTGLIVRELATYKGRIVYVGSRKSNL